MPPHAIAMTSASSPTSAAIWEAIMRENNQVLFRIARSIVRNDSEAEDVVQASYVAAFSKFDTFDARSDLGPWLRRIVANRALDRLRKVGREDRLSKGHEIVEKTVRNASMQARTPEELAERAHLREVLEHAIDDLPESLRSVFVMKEVQGLSGADVADTLGLDEGAIRVRLHRARKQLRESIGSVAPDLVTEAFAFDGERCDRIVRRTVQTLLGQRTS